MTRCHYGHEELAATDRLPVRDHPGAFACAAHSMLYAVNALADAGRFTLASAIEAMKLTARRDPRQFVKATTFHMAKSPHFTMALLLAIGHELPTAAVERLLMEITRLDDVPEAAGLPS